MQIAANVWQPLNEYFDHIYVITLQRATERHERIKAVLAGLNFSFFYGADNKNFTISDLISRGIYDEKKAINIHRYNKPMKPGMLGCSWSHKMVYEDIIANNFQRALILEDDVLPVQDSLTLFAAILQELPANWQLLYFDYHKNDSINFNARIKQIWYHVQKTIGALKWSRKTINHLYALSYSKHLLKAGYHDFTSAYCLTQPAAQLLNELQTPISHFPDGLLAHACSNQLINAFICKPKLFIQESQTNKAFAGSYVEE